MTVYRPLRVNFQTSPERIDDVMTVYAIQRMTAPAQQRLIDALRGMDASVVHRNREQFSKLLKKSLADHDVFPSTPELRALLNALSERDPEADICMTKRSEERR